MKKEIIKTYMIYTRQRTFTRLFPCRESYNNYMTPFSASVALSLLKLHTCILNKQTLLENEERQQYSVSV